MSIEEFYRNKYPANGKEGPYYLNDILKWDDQKLEEEDSYIKWLFPLPRSSAPRSLYSSNPILTEELQKEFSEQPRLRKLVNKALNKIMDYYGFKLRSGDVVRNNKELCRGNITGLCGSHNVNRITRIIEFLQAINMPKKALLVFLAMCRAMEEDPRVKENFIKSGIMKYWWGLFPFLQDDREMYDFENLEPKREKKSEVDKEIEVEIESDKESEGEPSEESEDSTYKKVRLTPEEDEEDWSGVEFESEGEVPLDVEYNVKLDWDNVDKQLEELEDDVDKDEEEPSRGENKGEVSEELRSEVALRAPESDEDKDEGEEVTESESEEEDEMYPIPEDTEEMFALSDSLLSKNLNKVNHRERQDIEYQWVITIDRGVKVANELKKVLDRIAHNREVEELIDEYQNFNYTAIREYDRRIAWKADPNNPMIKRFKKNRDELLNSKNALEERIKRLAGKIDLDKISQIIERYNWLKDKFSTYATASSNIVAPNIGELDESIISSVIALKKIANEL